MSECGGAVGGEGGGRGEWARWADTLPIPDGKFWSPYLGKATAATRAALPIPISVCSLVLCPDNGMASSVGDF